MTDQRPDRNQIGSDQIDSDQIDSDQLAKHQSEQGEIVVLDARDTHELRRRVLRDGRPDASVEWAGDDDATTLHLGVVVDEAIAAISTWLTTPSSAGRLTQLRGMASEPTLAGTGIGRRLLRAGIDRAAQQGTELVWANARVGALRFYERSGFTIVGDEFTIVETGLPHRRVEYPISPPHA